MAWASASSLTTTFASSSTGDKTMETSFKWKLTKEVNEGMERLSWRLVKRHKKRKSESYLDVMFSRNFSL